MFFSQDELIEVTVDGTEASKVIPVPSEIRLV